MSGPPSSQSSVRRAVRRKPPPELVEETRQTPQNRPLVPESSSTPVSMEPERHYESRTELRNSYKTSGPPLPPKVRAYDTSGPTISAFRTSSSDLYQVPPITNHTSTNYIPNQIPLPPRPSKIFINTQPTHQYSYEPQYPQSEGYSHSQNSYSESEGHSHTHPQGAPTPTNTFTNNHSSYEPWKRATPNILPDLSYVDESFDETFVLLEKPMGPRDLPEYDSLPYPTNDLGDILSDLDENDVHVSSPVSQADTTPLQHQYYNSSYDESNPVPLSSDTVSASFINSSPVNSYSLALMGSILPSRSSPRRSNTQPFTSVYLRLPTSGNTLPRRMSTYDNRRGISSRPMPPSAGSSRSPSPKKRYDRSPLLRYGEMPPMDYDRSSEDEYTDSLMLSPPRSYIMTKPSSHYEAAYDASIIKDHADNIACDFNLNENPFNDQYYNDYDYDQSPSPHWRESNHVYYDDENYSSDGSTNFDYSVLPEIPSSATTDQSSSNFGLLLPGKRMTLTLAISFVKKNPMEIGTPIDPQLGQQELPPIPLDLPQLPFTSSTLGALHFQQCRRIWLMKEIFVWCLQLEKWLHEQFMPVREFKKSLIKLLVYHRNDVPLDVISMTVDQIIHSLKEAGAVKFHDKEDPIQPIEEVNTTNHKKQRKEKGVVFNQRPISGILPDLLPCYCYKGYHSNIVSLDGTKLRCYSSHCYLNMVIQHEIAMKNTNINDIKLTNDDWASYWKLTAADLSRFPNAIAKRQLYIYDLFKSEQSFIERGSCFVNIVGPNFVKDIPNLVSPLQLVPVKTLKDDIISPGKELVKIHKSTLMEPLLKILVADGKFVKSLVEIADLYFHWSELVKTALLQYIGTLPMIESLMRIPKVKDWVENVRSYRKVKELKVNGHLLFFSTFNSRWQHLPLQLTDIQSLFDPSDDEHKALGRAISGIKNLGTKINEMKKHADNIYELKRVQSQLIWKNLAFGNIISWGSENRKVFYRGDVTRKGDLKINTYVNHLILLDNYLLITERVKSQKTGLQFKVVESPIPVELMIVEIKETDGDSSSGIKMSNELTVNVGKTDWVGRTNVETKSDEEDDSIFLFKIRFAGRGKHFNYIFLTKSERQRRDWIIAIIQAKSNLYERLNKVAPYIVKTVSSHTFAYDSTQRVTKLQVCAPKDPLDAGSSESLAYMNKIKCKNLYMYNNAKYKFVFGKVLNFVSFEYKGATFHLVGLTLGLYCSDTKNGWRKLLNGPDITKISVDTNIKIVVILGNKTLRYYLLDLMVGVYLEKREKLTGISLSNEPVVFYELGKHRKTTMLFYAKKKGNSAATNFKVMIPELDNDGIFSGFKLWKKFYVQADSFGLSIFNTSFAVLTTKGIEVLELDKLLPRSIPEIPAAPQGSEVKKIEGYGRKSMDSALSSVSLNTQTAIDQIRKLVNSSGANKPMGMFKLANNSEFLLVYNTFALFTNKHGKLSRFLVLRFDFKARKIAFVQNNLFVACEEVLEIWSISDFVNGTNQLIQVVTGKDVSIISDGDNVSVAVANPKVPGLQLVLELVAKEGKEG